MSCKCLPLFSKKKNKKAKKSDEEEEAKDEIKDL